MASSEEDTLPGKTSIDRVPAKIFETGIDIETESGDKRRSSKSVPKPGRVNRAGFFVARAAPRCGLFLPPTHGEKKCPSNPVKAAIP
jgi:hypothetical protein